MELRPAPCHAPRVTARGFAEALAAESVAVIADVHGNAVALEAVCEEVARAEPEAVIFLGDLTCGPLPVETWKLIGILGAAFPNAVHFVRGNTERAMLTAGAKLAAGASGVTARERWLLENHTQAMRDAIASFAAAIVLNVSGLGLVRFCHGSPRSDEEMITPATPAKRIRGPYGRRR